MTTISDKDRAEAQAMAEVFLGCDDLAALGDNVIPWWLAVRDRVLAAHECQTVPAWRPTTADEIQPGWEIRSRRRNGSEAGWGVAHNQGDDGDWLTASGVLLTYTDVGWTYETTAPEPEPWDEDTLDEWEDALRSTIDLDAGWTTSTRAVLNLLASRGLIERPKAGA